MGYFIAKIEKRVKSPYIICKVMHNMQNPCLVRFVECKIKQSNSKGYESI